MGFYAHPTAARYRHDSGIAGGWDLYPPRLTNFRVFMYHTAGLDQYRSFPSGSMLRSPEGGRNRLFLNEIGFGS